MLALLAAALLAETSPAPQELSPAPQQPVAPQPSVAPPQPAAPSQPSVAVPNLRGAGTSDAQRAVWSDHVAQELRNAGVKVMSSRDIETVLGVERQRQMLGCSDDMSSCLAELTSALGTDYTVTGDVSEIPGGYRVDVGVIKGSSPTRLAGYTEQVGDEGAVLRALSRGGWRLGSVMLARAGQLPIGLAPDAVVVGEPPPGRRISWVPAAIGAASLVAGTLLVIRAYDNLRQLDPVRPISLEDAARYRDEGKTLYPIGVTCIVVGVAAAAVSGVLFFAGGGQPRGVQLSAIATPQGAAVALAGSLP